jgi:hypothetical protein
LSLEMRQYHVPMRPKYAIMVSSWIWLTAIKLAIILNSTLAATLPLLTIK